MKVADRGVWITPWFFPVTLPPIKRQLARFLRRFSPTLARLDADGIHPLPCDGSGPLRLLVARELCLFLHVDASVVPARERTGFVMLAVRRAAPFDDPELDIVWFGSHAAIWYWSAARARELAGPLPARARIHAEAAHRGEVSVEDGVELLDLSQPTSLDDAASNGIEARLWRNGHLAACRWWPGIPSESAWRVFLRGTGMPSTLHQPEPVHAQLHGRPLGGNNTQLDTLSGQLHAQWPLLAAGLGCLVAAAFCWQLAGIAHAHVENSKVKNRIGQLEKRLDSVITARNTADEASATAESLLRLRPPASQTRLLAEIVKITPPGDWSVMLWQQPGPETLEVTLKGNGLDATAIVNAWEQSPFLQDVTPATSNRPDELMIRARLSPSLEGTQ